MAWLFVLAVLAEVGNPNFVQNGGFEQAAADMPEKWNVFVLERPDAQRAAGRIDQTAFEGERSAFLHNPTAYKEEPFNNWNQVLWGEYSGMELKVSGAIKTDDATGAAIWLQCWQRAPYKLLAVVSTGDRTAITGTTDWTRVQADLEVPKGTDFLMLRCVLRGKGKAWFDSVSVEEKIVVPHPAPPSGATDQSATLEAPEPPKPATQASQLEELKEMLQSLRAHSNSNDSLMAQVESLQTEIKSLRDQLSVLQEAANAAVAGVPAEPAQNNETLEEPPPPQPIKQKGVPPLVPHGLKPEDYAW